MDAFGKTVAVILAVLLLFIFPLQYIAGNQSTVVENIVSAEATELADNAMLQGYITVDQYEEFLDKLDSTGQLYDIEIVRSVPSDGYTTGSNGNTINTSFTEGADQKSQGISNLLYQTATPKISNLLYNNSGTNSAMLQLATHYYHTAACYAGHNHNVSGCSYHTHTGSSSTGGGCYGKENYHEHSSSCYTTGPCNTWTTVTSRYTGYYYCSICKKNTATTQYRNICGACGGVNETYVVRSCGHGDSVPSSKLCTASVTKLTCSISTTTPISYSLNCNINEGWQCGLSNDNTPICDTVVTGLTPTALNQTVIKGNSIDVTATATYLDGHTGKVTCASDYNGAVGTQTVTLTYSGKVTNAQTTGSLTTTTTIVTKPSVTYGLILTPSKTLMYKGDSSPAFTLTLNGSDGSQSTIISGYTVTKAFSPSTIGTQTITYGYTYDGTDYTASCTVQVKPNVTSLAVVPSAYTVLNGTEPTYTVTAKYEDGSSKTVTTYTKTGFTTGAGTKSVQFSYTENNKTVTASVSIVVNRNTKICPNGHVYELDDIDNDFGCPICAVTISKISASPKIVSIKKGDPFVITVIATYLDNHTVVVANGWTSNFNPAKLGTQNVTVSYKGYTDTIQVNVTANNFVCPIDGTVYAPNDDGSDPGCPVCSIYAVSLKASPAIQTVQVNGKLNLTVTATFQNGTTKVITDWTSGFNSNIAGQQLVTIYYHNVSTTVTAFVTSESLVTCPIDGTNYNPITNPDGCPVCSKTLESINAYLNDSENKVPFGSELSLSVILNYRNGKKIYATGGWTVTGYNSIKLGVQNIVVHYQGLSTSLTIEVVETMGKTTCPNGHVYYLNSDGSDPGCPYCTLGEENGGSKNYYTNIYTDEILQDLYTNGTYNFNEGDYITIIVTPKPFSTLGRLKRMFLNKGIMDKNFSYGGLVHLGILL